VQRNHRDKYNRNVPPVSTFLTRKGLKLPVELHHNIYPVKALVDLKKVTAFLLPYFSGSVKRYCPAQLLIRQPIYVDVGGVNSLHTCIKNFPQLAIDTEFFHRAFANPRMM
jgi:hypothetical protein